MKCEIHHVLTSPGVEECPACVLETDVKAGREIIAHLETLNKELAESLEEANNQLSSPLHPMSLEEAKAFYIDSEITQLGRETVKILDGYGAQSAIVGKQILNLYIDMQRRIDSKFIELEKEYAERNFQTVEVDKEQLELPLTETEEVQEGTEDGTDNTDNTNNTDSDTSDNSGSTGVHEETGERP